MALERIPLNPGAGPIAVAVDRIGTNDYELIKVVTGGIGTNGGPVTTANPFPVSGTVGVYIDASNAGPFGDLIAQPMTPLLQLDFTYGINTQTGLTTVANSATVDTSSARLRVQSGTNAAGSGTFVSRRPAKYRAGQGVVARFTAAFTAGKATSTQIVGMGDENDGYFFGYNGTAFGILHRNATTPTWIAQTAWNGDKCDGTGASGFDWNKTYGNVCQIKYPFLGYGNITFWVQNTATSAWILCHTIHYTNTTATIQISNPNLPFQANSINSGNNTNLIIYVGSVGVFLVGERSFIGNPKWAVDNFKNNITTETNIFTVKNCTTFNGVSNHGLLRFNSVSIASTSNNGIAVLRLKVGATLGGNPSYTTINGTTADQGVTITAGNSIASFDIAGTTVANGTYIFNITVASPAGSGIIDLTPFNIILAPGEILTFSGFSTASTTIGISANWTEDI